MKNNFGPIFAMLKRGVSIVIGLLIVIYILYIRLFRDKTPKNLRENLYASGEYVILGIYFSIFLLFAFLLLKQLFYFYKPDYKTTYGIFSKLGYFYSQCLREIFEFVTKLLFPAGAFRPFIEKMGLYLFENYKTVWKRRMIFTIFHILPRLIIILIFARDVFWFHRFHYIYIFSFLLLVPMFSSFIHFLFESFSDTNLRILGKIFVIVDLKNNNKYTPEEFYYWWENQYPLNPKDFWEDYGMELTPGFIDKQNKKNRLWNTQKTLNLYVDWYVHTLSIVTYTTNKFSETKSIYLQYFNFLMKLAYMVIWGYIIYYGF